MAPGDVRHSRRRHSPSWETGAPAGTAGQGGGEVQRGVIKWFNREKGYGFIRCQDGEEVFVHESAVILGTNDLILAKGREVEFEVRLTARGSQAFSVVVLGEADPDSRPEQPAVSAAAPSASAAPETRQPEPPSDPPLDFARTVPASWQRRPAVRVYTYTIYGRRGD